MSVNKINNVFRTLFYMLWVDLVSVDGDKLTLFKKLTAGPGVIA